MHIVGADDHREDVVETERCVHVVAAAGRLAQSMGGALCEEAVDALLGAVQWLLGNAELPGIPEVHAGLIADLYIDAQVGERPRATPDNLVLPLPTEVAEVAIEDVVVGDAMGRWKPTDVVPDGLTEASGSDIAVRQPQLRQPVGQGTDGLIRNNDVDEQGPQVRLRGGGRHRAQPVALATTPRSCGV